MVLAEDGSTSSGLLQVKYPDTGESGDTYDIDVLTGPFTKTQLELKVPSPGISVRLLDTAESGDAYDAEVNQFSTTGQP